MVEGAVKYVTSVFYISGRRRAKRLDINLGAKTYNNYYFTFLPYGQRYYYDLGRIKDEIQQRRRRRRVIYFTATIW